MLNPYKGFPNQEVLIQVLSPFPLFPLTKGRRRKKMKKDWNVNQNKRLEFEFPYFDEKEGGRRCCIVNFPFPE